jgi:hypothetical protein
MKLVVAALLIALVGAKFVKISNNKYCKRKVTASLSMADTRFVASSILNCQKGGNSNGRAGALVFTMNARPLPTYKLAGKAKAADSSAAFLARFAIDKIVEYVETNNVTGYQPGADTFVSDINLVSTQWSAFDRSSTDVDSDTKVDQLTTTLTKNGVTFRIGAQITTDEVQTGNDTTKIVLTPNSFKTVFSVENLSYSNPNSRYAIGALLFVAGADRDTTNSKGDTAGDRPDDNNARQGVASLKTAGSNSGFFSWQKFVMGKNATIAVSSVTLVESAITVASDTNQSRDDDEVGFVIQRIFFTVRDQVSEFSWDPSLGQTEAAESSSNNSATTSITRGSNIVALLIVLIALLSMA